MDERLPTDVRGRLLEEMAAHRGRDHEDRARGVAVHVPDSVLAARRKRRILPVERARVGPLEQDGASAEAGAEDRSDSRVPELEHRAGTGRAHDADAAADEEADHASREAEDHELEDRVDHGVWSVAGSCRKYQIELAGAITSDVNIGLPLQPKLERYPAFIVVDGQGEPGIEAYRE